MGINPESGLIQMDIKGLAEPKSPEAERICREDLTELITAFVQDKQTIERGLFDEELLPEDLTQVRMGNKACTIAQRNQSSRRNRSTDGLQRLRKIQVHF